MGNAVPVDAIDVDAFIIILGAVISLPLRSSSSSLSACRLGTTFTRSRRGSTRTIIRADFAVGESVNAGPRMILELSARPSLASTTTVLPLSNGNLPSNKVTDGWLVLFCCATRLLLLYDEDDDTAKTLYIGSTFTVLFFVADFMVCNKG